MLDAMQLLSLVLSAGLIIAMYRENRRLRAELSDTESANEGLTEELDNWRSEAGEQRQVLH